MRILSYLASLVVATTLSLLAPGQALAQSWKPLCVNGGNTAGVHNSTWQKVNTPGAGGSTWKKAGGCIAPPPPPPPPPPTCANGAPNPPTCTFPPPPGRTLTAGFDQGYFQGSPSSHPIGYRGVTYVETAETSSNNPSGAISDRNLNGATIAEMADYASAFNPIFTVTVIGTYPMNLFNSITINGVTVSSSVCTTNIYDPNRVCDFSTWTNNGTVYTVWSWYSVSMGMVDGVTYPLVVH